MIRVIRRVEPAGLTQRRWWRLARYRAAIHASTASDKLFVGYDVDPVKSTLREDQHQKCAYCERWEEERAHPIEHFRPKGGSIRSSPGVTPQQVDSLHYWWLAWSWENLFFSCVTCNSYKRNYFPLAAGAMALAQESFALSSEDALLIDPAQQDPIAHIQFIPSSSNGHTNWIPVARRAPECPPSPYGAETIKLLKLDRPDLLELYNEHVSVRLEPKVLLLKALIEANASSLAETWLSVISEHLWDKIAWGLDKPFAALTYDVFDHYFPRAQRKQLGLRLVRPGRDAPLTAGGFAAPTFLTAQAPYHEKTQWAIRAIGPQSSSEHDEYLKAALRAVLHDPAYEPMLSNELTTLLSPPISQALTKVEDALMALLSDGLALKDKDGKWSPHGALSA